MKMVSAYPGKLILPDGTEVSSGQECNADAANNGVADFMAQGWLIEVKATPAKK